MASIAVHSERTTARQKENADPGLTLPRHGNHGSGPPNRALKPTDPFRYWCHVLCSAEAAGKGRATSISRGRRLSFDVRPPLPMPPLSRAQWDGHRSCQSKVDHRLTDQGNTRRAFEGKSEGRFSA